MNQYFVYIMANNHNTTLYIGVTNDLERRVTTHKQNINKGFAKKYNLHKLVYFVECGDINAAIAYEKKLKKWRREWKDGLITKTNPTWSDLSSDWLVPCGDPGLAAQQHSLRS